MIVKLIFKNGNSSILNNVDRIEYHGNFMEVFSECKYSYEFKGIEKLEVLEKLTDEFILNSITNTTISGDLSSFVLGLDAKQIYICFDSDLSYETLQDFFFDKGFRNNYDNEDNDDFLVIRNLDELRGLSELLKIEWYKGHYLKSILDRIR